MDLRSIQPGLAAVSQMPLFLIHPQTGEMITPLMWSKTGAPVWPGMGGAPEEGEGADGDKDDDADEDAGEDEDEDSNDDDSDDEDEDDDDEGQDGKKGKKKGNAQAKIKALEEEKDRHFRRARKERKARESAEAELAALRAKYESGDDKGKDDKDGKPKVDDAKIKLAEAAAQKLRVENAFLRVNEVTWIKPEQALALMLSDDDYEVEFDDDGKVDRKSLRAELKRFAKANPHLVKKPAAKTDDEDDADESGSGSKSTAPKMNGTRKGKKDKPKSREELAKKFPALNRIP